MHRIVAPLLLVLFAVVVGACSSGTSPAAAVRTVEVVTTDQMRYEPAAFEFAVGDRVRFSVRNPGAVPHELFVGTAQEQATHETEMQAGHAMHDHANSVTVEPGKTDMLELTFARAGTLEIGCHIPGHWDAGMRGTITVK